MNDQSLYQAIKSEPGSVVYHKGCEKDFDWDTGQTWCLEHGVGVCQVCGLEIEKGG